MSIRNDTTFYESAFSAEFTAIWSGTPFKNEIPELSYIRAGSCFLGNSDANEDARRQLLYAYLKSYFSVDKDTDPLNKEYPNLPTDNLSVMRILNNLCNLYTNEPKRTLTIGETPIKDGTLADLYQAVNINSIMKQVHKVGRLLNECIIRPRKYGGKYELQVLTPDLYRTKKDPITGTVTELAVPFSNENGDLRFDVWTADSYKQKDIEYRDVEFTYSGISRAGVLQETTYGKEGMRNIYGRIPFTFAKFAPNPDVYGGINWSLVRSQLMANTLDMLRDENLIYSGFGMWHLLNMFKNGNEEIEVGPGKVYTTTTDIDMPEAEIRHVKADESYQDIQAIKEELLRDTMRNMGLPSALVDSNPGLAASGVAMQIDRIELEEARQEDKGILSRIEYDLLQNITNVYNKENKGSIPDYQLTIDYKEQGIMEKDKELEYNTELFSKGLITVSQYVKRTTGQELDTQSAIEFINKNKGAYNETRAGDGVQSQGNE